MPIEEFSDLNVCLSNLFLEISILIAFYFTTQRDNDAIAIKHRENENYVYYLKKNTKSQDGKNKDGSKRWVCNVPKCNASLHTNEKGELIKMNNVSFDKFTDVRSFHAHDALNDNDSIFN